MSSINPRYARAVRLLTGPVLFLASSCSDQTPVDPDHSAPSLSTAATITKYTVSPGTATVSLGGKVQFTASATWSDGTTKSAPTIWLTNGGAITTDGLYLAPSTTGTYMVVGYSKESGIRDTTSVAVGLSSSTTKTVKSVSITPSLKTLSPGQAQQFSAEVTYSDGSKGTGGVTWTAAGGSMTSAGLYTAGSTTGTYRIIGQASGSTAKDTSSVTISTAKVTKLVLSPGTISLAPGGSQQFSASATWSDGVSRPVTLSYTAAGGTVSSTGLYQAGTTAGSYWVKVTCSGCSVADTSSVSIVAATTTTTLAATHRPSDHLTVHDINFDSKYFTNWAFNHKWGDPAYMQSVSDAAAPRSAQRGIEFGFPAGFEDINSPARANTVFSASREMYVAVWIKISKPWQYHTSSVNKLFLLSTNAHSTWGNEVVVALKGTTESNAQIQIGVQTPANSQAGTKNGFFLPNISQPGFSLGVWHLIEIKAVRSTGGLYNGRLDWWVDGKLVGSHSNVKYYSYGDSYFNGMILDPNWGGQGSPPKVRRDWIRLDHLVITRK
jgi:hypothetical protein